MMLKLAILIVSVLVASFTHKSWSAGASPNFWSYCMWGVVLKTTPEKNCRDDGQFSSRPIAPPG